MKQLKTIEMNKEKTSDKIRLKTASHRSNKAIMVVAVQKRIEIKQKYRVIGRSKRRNKKRH